MWQATTCAWSAELWLPFPTFWKFHQRASSPPVPGTKGIVNPPWELESLVPLTGSKYNSAYELIGKNSNLLMIVGCSFGRWGKSRTFWSLENFGSPSVSEDLETLFPVASGLSNKPTSSLHRDHLKDVWVLIICRSFQAKDMRLTVDPFLGCMLGVQRWRRLRPCRHYQSLGSLNNLLSHPSACTPDLLTQFNPPSTGSERNLWNANLVQPLQRLHSALKMSTRILSRT